MDIRKRDFWKRKVTISVLLFLLVQNLSGQTFILNGTIIGKDTGYVIFQYRDENNQRRSKVTSIKRGKFHFKGTITNVDFASINTDTNYIYFDKQFGASFFLEPGTIDITFKNGEVDKAVIKGSKSQSEYVAFKKSQSKERSEMKRLSASGDSIRNLLKNGLIDPKIAEEERKKINEKYHPIFQTLMKTELAYIKKYPHSHVSLILLYSLVGRISNDSIDILYSILSDKVKNSSLDFRFIEYNLKYRKAVANEYPFDKLKLNERAPPFTIYQTSNGDSLTNSHFKGKVLIIEFWGLYCFPCLKFNPFLENNRKQYTKSKIEIIAINVNQDKEMPELITYINKNKLSEWIHVAPNTELQYINNLIFKGDFTSYSGLGVPRTILIDKNGMVVYKNYGYSVEELQNLKSLIDKVVNEDAKSEL